MGRQHCSSRQLSLAVTPLLAAMNMGDFAVIYCVAMSYHHIYTHFVE